MSRSFGSATKRLVNTVDSHTAGHPTRVVTGGLPPLRGRTVAERADDFRDRFDAIRTFLLHEPRGHAAMVGVVLTESATADFGAFFLGSYKYLEMCGHATIGLAVTLDHLGLIAPGPDGRDARFSLEVPAGIIEVRLAYEGGRIESVDFDNVPAFVAASGVEISYEGRSLAVDIAYGGNWYALVAAREAGIDLTPSGVSRAMTVGAALKAQVNVGIAASEIAGQSVPVDSVLFYETTREETGTVSQQLVVLESNKFDRSPCGTGTSARLAQLFAQGRISAGETIRSRNILGIEFQGSATPLSLGPEGQARIVPSVRGLAHITGIHAFVLTEGDPIAAGFLCR